MFDWRRDVPIWACREFYRRFFTGGASSWRGWKATPKGGKLSYETFHGEIVTVQLYK